MDDIRQPHDSRRAASALRSAINQRANNHVRELVEQRYWSQLDAWAREDSVGFPSRRELEAQTRMELELLCRGLGGWAAISPGSVFPPEASRGRSRNEWFEEPDDWW